MSNNNYIEEIKKNLAFLGDIQTKNMFGTMAFSLDGIYFASISKNQLYFKVDEKSQTEFENYKMPPYVTRGKSIDYFQVPKEILLDKIKFRQWSKRALEAAKMKKSK